MAKLPKLQADSSGGEPAVIDFNLTSIYEGHQWDERKFRWRGGAAELEGPGWSPSNGNAEFLGWACCCRLAITLELVRSMLRTKGSAFAKVLMSSSDVADMFAWTFSKSRGTTCEVPRATRCV